MNESKITQNSININEIETNYSSKRKNIPQSFSSLQLMQKNKIGIQKQEINNKTETSTIMNSSILNDYYSLHTSKLSSSISLINKQMSNMMINSKHYSKSEKFSIECVHFNINSISENKLIENEQLKKEIEQLKIKIKEERAKTRNDKRQEENNIIFQLAQDINNLKEEISKNNIRYKEIKNEYDQIFNENMMLKRMIKELKEEKNTKQQKFTISKQELFDILPKRVTLFEKDNTYISSLVTNTITDTTGNIQTTTSRNISFLTDNIDLPYKELLRKNFSTNNNQIIPLYSKKRISSLTNNNNLLNQTYFSTYKKQKKLHESSVFGEISNQRNRNYPIIEKKVSLSQKKLHLHKDLENYKLHFDNTTCNMCNNNEVNSNYLVSTTIKSDNSINENSKISITQLYRIDFSNKRIISFDLKTHKYHLSLYEDMNNFNVLYQTNGSSFLSTNNNLYIITGPLFNSFYSYSPKEHTIIQLQSLINNHEHSMMILFGNEKIICISGKSTPSVEEYSIKSNIWRLYPSLKTTRANSNCLIQNNSNLFVSFGYDYFKMCFLNTIEILNLNNPIEWKQLQVDFNIRYHATFITTETKEEDSTFFIVGGCYGEDNKPNMDLIELQIKKNNCNVIRNTQKEKSKKNNNEYQFLFNQSLIDFLDTDNYSWKKCGFDDRGDVHMIDIASLKHKIFNYKEKE